MDVHRSIGAVSPEIIAAESASAVAAMHKAMVALREEIAKKNQIIEQLKEQKEEEPKPLGNGTLNFDDLFEPAVEYSSAAAAR